MGAAKNSKVDREERQKQLVLKHKFENRITIAKFGKESLNAGDYPKALKNFTEYLNIMTEVKKCADIYSLKVGLFDPKRDLTELLMISHIYFELARIYDASSKFKNESQRCLDQFVHFSANQPFQVINSEMIRKYLKKYSFNNPEAFRHAYQQIFVQSKKCYVVTYCFGEDHPVTSDFRKFKDWLLNFEAGQKAVGIYYRHSSTLVSHWEDSRVMHILGRYFVSPALVLFSKTILRFILK